MFPFGCPHVSLSECFSFGAAVGGAGLDSGDGDAAPLSRCAHELAIATIKRLPKQTVDVPVRLNLWLDAVNSECIHFDPCGVPTPCLSLTTFLPVDTFQFNYRQGSLRQASVPSGAHLKMTGQKTHL
jgi:hypothetical protein